MVLAVVLLSLCISLVAGHGYMADPPNRSSLFRNLEDELIKPYKDMVVANYNDNQNFCGGASYQQNEGGKCGLCGDPILEEQPRDNESGGKYGKGIVVRRYEEGQLITVTIKITANHKGFFEFSLIPWNDQGRYVDLTKTELYLLNTVDGNTHWNLESTGTGDFQIQLKLPDGVICHQCVLRWRYHTGNSWGCDDNGSCGIGNGPQEEFYSCADIAIGTDVLPPPNANTGENPQPDLQTTTKATKTTENGVKVTTTTTTTTKVGDIVTTKRPYPVTTTTKAPVDADCKDKVPNKLYPVPGECDSFFQCTADGRLFVKQCSSGLMFNPETEVCDWSENVEC